LNRFGHRASRAMAFFFADRPSRGFSQTTQPWSGSSFMCARPTAKRPRHERSRKDG
jgi:hypothetical protein